MAVAPAAGASTSTIVTSYVRQWLRTSGLTGVAVSVVRADGSAYDVATGAHLDATPMTASERFDLSSVSKTFTAALVWRAVDQGLIDPDALVGPLAAAPAFPYANRFTVRQLLMHQTGLVNYRDTPQFVSNPASIATPEAALAASGSRPLLFAPGTSEAYSSSNYLVLGLLLEQVTGRSFDDLLRSQLLVPLGLSQITHRAPQPGAPNFSTAGIMATTGETARWLDALLGRDGAGLSDASYGALVDQSSGASFTAGLWNYCPCSVNDENGPQFFAMGTSGTDVMAMRSSASGVTVVVHAADQIWDPPGRNNALQDLVRDIDYIERLGKAPATHPVLVHTGVASTVYVGNLTITQPSAAGYATAFPCAAGLPPTSNVNFDVDETVANLTLVSTDAAGDLCITPSTDAHVIFDHGATIGGVTSYPGVRALDTRASGRAVAGVARRVHVGSPGSVVVGNLTITQPETAGYATVYPCLAGLPPTSNINFAAGRTVANLTLTPTDANGDLCVTTSAAAHVIFDQTGTVSAITPHAPVRAIDTRN